VLLFNDIGMSRSGFIRFAGVLNCVMPIALAAGDDDMLIAISRHAAAITEGLYSRQE